MNNIMEFNGYKAVINYDPEIEMFRGEFINLNGGADFYAVDIQGLHKEGVLSLDMFLEMCKEDGVEPLKQYSGKFNVRLPPSLHEDVVTVAAASGISINQLVINAVSYSVQRI